MSPMATRAGKGYWGNVEGLEALFEFDASIDSFVNNPLNFRQVQVLAMQPIAAVCAT